MISSNRTFITYQNVWIYANSVEKPVQSFDSEKRCSLNFSLLVEIS